jgi:hypothetical protein
MSAPAITESPWLSTEDLAVYLRRPSAEAARKWASRHGLVPARAGRTLLYARIDVDAMITGGVPEELRLVGGRGCRR